MKAPLRFTRAAEADLEEIADFIARDNPNRALAFVRALRDRCMRIGDHPQAAPLRPEICEDIRLVVHSNHLILYSLRERAVVIERIVHGARYLPALFHPSGGVR